MAYIGVGPLNKGIGLFSQDTFTGDGSTTTFDLTHEAPDAGGNEIQVFVDNVRQQEGSSNAYTLGLNGSSENKRITFTTAPAASQSIFVLNPGTKNVQQITTLSDNVVSSAKLQALSVSTAKIAADAVDATKLADDAISEEHLDVTAITGNTELSATADDADVLLIFDTSAGTIKKIQRSNVALSNPTFSSVSPTTLTTGDGTGNHTIIVTGTKFDASCTFKLRTDGGADIDMDSVTRNSATQLTGTVAKSTANLTNANEPFDIIITNGTGLATTATNQINIDAAPAFVTGAGTLGTLTGGSAMTTVDIVAADPESAGTVTFDFKTGGLPAGLSSTTVHENGVSKLRITGTPTNPTATTTTNFTLRASDPASNTSTRAFSFTVNRTPQSTSFTSSGTFAVPSGVTSLNSVLVIAGGGAAGPEHGGGGGAGGLIFMPAVPVTPGGTIAVTVGDGGTSSGSTGPADNPQPGWTGQDSVFGASPSPGISAALTAKGGGSGGNYHPGNSPGTVQGDPGGSAGGGAAPGSGPVPSGGPGTALQPTQPGNSGAYGFGNVGGAIAAVGAPYSSAGGGGAGGTGADGGASARAGNGGIGKAYTIADGTTSVYYAGGGAGGNYGPYGQYTGTNAQGGVGGQGGGGDGNSLANDQPGPGQSGQNGTANTGGGAGSPSRWEETQPGSGRPQAGGTVGGKGIVIVRC